MMLKSFMGIAAACGMVLAGAGIVTAAEISGDYLEARTCDTYTGPCFANAEVGLTGREAMMAWSINEGAWNGVDLAGLNVVAVIRGNDTLGFGGGVTIQPYPIRSVLIVDERASDVQAEALVDFARHQAGVLLADVVRVERAPISLEMDRAAGAADLQVGELAELSTRPICECDCVCTNEMVFYPPLVEVDGAAPAVTVDHRFSGEGLGATWSSPNKRSAFLASFAY